MRSFSRASIAARSWRVRWRRASFMSRARSHFSASERPFRTLRGQSIPSFGERGPSVVAVDDRSVFIDHHRDHDPEEPDAFTEGRVFGIPEGCEPLVAVTDLDRQEEREVPPPGNARVRFGGRICRPRGLIAGVLADFLPELLAGPSRPLVTDPASDGGQA